MTDNASQSRARWLLVLLALTAALFLVVASACGGDDDDDDGGDDAGATATESTDGGDDSGDGGDETPADNGDDGGDDGSDAAADLAALAGEYEQFEGYVKYAATDFGGTDSSLSSMAIYQKEGYSRIDIESSDGNVTLITTPDATYMCAEEQCLKYPAGEDTGDAAGAFTQFIDPGTIEDQFGDLPDGVDVNVSEEKIAGVNATCFSASGDLDDTTPGDESGEVCFAEGGLLLRLTFESAGESGTLEAVEADSEVDESDFEPPFEVVDLSDLGQ